MISDAHVWLLMFFVYLIISIYQSDFLFAGMNQSESYIEMNKQKTTTTKREYRCSCSTLGVLKIWGNSDDPLQAISGL